MQRVMIVGGAGSGKSTLARALGRRTGLPVHHLDALFWKPGWVESEREEFAQRLRLLYREPRWIVEGNYSATWPERIAAADTFLFLDVATALRLWRISRRVLGSYGRVRPDMAAGCPERIDWAFFRWAATYDKRDRRKTLDALEEARASTACRHLRGRKAAAAFLTSLDGRAS